MFDVAIIGCGVVGASITYRLAAYNLKTVVLEAENDISTGTTKANSGIVHAGYDPKPGTLMAKLNVEGAQMIRELAPKLDIPYKQIGSLVLAFSQEEVATLHDLLKRGLANGVQELRIIEQQELRAMEPELSHSALAALHAPTAGVIIPWELTLGMAEVAVNNGVQIKLNSKVIGISKEQDCYRLQTTSGEYKTRFVVNASGIHADQVHNLIAQPEFTIHPNKGEYYLMDKQEGTRVKRVIFQCPTKVGKGILVSPTAHGNLIVGPNAVDVSGNDTSTDINNLEFIIQSARKSVPQVNVRANIRNFAGVRAVADVDDFIIRFAQGEERFLDVAGIKSPGLTAAPAIGKMAVELLAERGLPLDKKADFQDSRKVVRFSELSVAEKKSLIANEPAYGRIICRCENVTEGEILAALHGPITPVSIDAIKRRTNAGMGRCQGGFCGPRVLELISRELNIAPCDVLQDTAGTKILACETKKRGTKHV